MDVPKWLLSALELRVGAAITPPQENVFETKWRENALSELGGTLRMSCSLASEIEVRQRR
jgi:hypothetical protein